jgi:hypothetical protein
MLAIYAIYSRRTSISIVLAVHLGAFIVLYLSDDLILDVGTSCRPVLLVEFMHDCLGEKMLSYLEG